MKNLLDAECWLEYLAGVELSESLDPIIENTSQLLVPTFVIADVFRTLLQHSTASAALRTTAHMQLGQVIEVDTDLSLAAARIGVKNELDLWHCYLLAIARLHEATLWTMNEELDKLPGVQVLKRKSDMRSFRLYR